MNGLDMMKERMLASIVNNLPPGVFENIGQIFQKVVSFDNRLTEIERKMDLLLTIAGYAPPAQTLRLENGHEPADTTAKHRSEPVGERE
jgi:hypothetical protein